MKLHFPEFLRELRRRRVYRVATVYAAVAFVVWQASEIAFPALGLPGWSITLVVVLTIAGFPLAVVLAWAFQVTPDGIRSASAESEASEAGGHAEDVEASDARESIVVLPFDNMSPDQDDAYLSDGLTEEITTDLSGLGTLRVFSRSSATVFKDQRKDVRSLGREHGVRYVLEGSVRKAGDSLRITAQLIDARTDEHLWAERYTGTMDDIFAMQEDVSRAIVDALHIELDAQEDRRLSERPIEDLQAYECYLRARQESWQFTEEALKRAVAHLERALSITGENALVLSGLAYVYSQMVNVGVGGDAAIDHAERYARRALELDRDSPQSHLVLGFLFEAVWRDPRKAARHLKRSLETHPDDPHALLWLTVAHSLIGDYPKMRRSARLALAVDPMTPMLRVMRGFIPMMEGRFEDAVDDFAEWFAEVQGNPAALMFYALVLAWSGRLEESREVLVGNLEAEPRESFARFSLMLRKAIEGDVEEMDAILSGRFRDHMIRDTQFTFFTASVQALAGRKEEALRWVRHALDGGFTNYPWLAEHDPCLAPYRGDAEFQELLGRAKSAWESAVGPSPPAEPSRR